MLVVVRMVRITVAVITVIIEAYCGRTEGQRTLCIWQTNSLRVVKATLAMGGCLCTVLVHTLGGEVQWVMYLAQASLPKVDS